MIDLKHVITSKLMTSFCDAGLLQVEGRVENTAICKAINPKAWDYDELAALALPCYRDLVYTTVTDRQLRGGLRSMLAATPLGTVYRAAKRRVRARSPAACSRTSSSTALSIPS